MIHVFALSCSADHVLMMKLLECSGKTSLKQTVVCFIIIIFLFSFKAMKLYLAIHADNRFYPDGKKNLYLCIHQGFAFRR